MTDIVLYLERICARFAQLCLEELLRLASQKDGQYCDPGESGQGMIESDM